MKDYAIINYEYERGYSLKNTENVYEVKPKGKISNFIIRILVKLKIICQYQERITSYSAKRVEVNTESIINDLCEKINMARYAYNNDIAGIMVGREHFELMRNEHITTSATMYGNMGYFEHGQPPHMMNIPIVLNPFIDGVVFCTKDMLKDMVWK